jgi:hypothetical protein
MQEMCTGEEIGAHEQQALRTRAHVERELKNELRAKLPKSSETSARRKYNKSLEG